MTFLQMEYSKTRLRLNGILNEWRKPPIKVNVNDIKLTEVGIYGEGDVITHIYNMEGTPKKGKINIPSIALAEFKNGKIQRINSN
jgi:hypothetical protein